MHPSLARDVFQSRVLQYIRVLGAWSVYLGYSLTTAARRLRDLVRRRVHSGPVDLSPAMDPSGHRVSSLSFFAF